MLNKVWKSFPKPVYKSFLFERYSYGYDEKFKAGLRTKEEVKEKFLEDFRGDCEKEVSFNDFLEYYQDLSVGIFSDDTFAQRILQNWGIKEDEENQISKAELRFILKSFREKLINKTHQKTDEFLLRKVFKEFDTNYSGFLSLLDLTAMMARLDIPMERKYIATIFNHLDANNNGFIEFEEFVHFVLNEFV